MPEEFHTSLRIVVENIVMPNAPLYEMKFIHVTFAIQICTFDRSASISRPCSHPSCFISAI